MRVSRSFPKLGNERNGKSVPKARPFTGRRLSRAPPPRPDVGHEPIRAEVDRESPVSYADHTMSVLTIRISDEEKAQLARRAKESGVSAGALVRRLLNESPLTSAEDLLKEMERRMGDQSLRVRRRK